MENCCGSQDLQQQQIVSAEIERQIRVDKKCRRREIKCLLFGSPGSGKSTFLKQMRIIYGEGYSLEDRKEYTKYVFQNIIEGMQALCKAMMLLQIEYSNDVANEKNVKLILQASTEDVCSLDEPISEAVEILWADSGIQKAWSRRREFCVPHSAKYFFNNLQRISASDFIPNEEDILHLNVPSNSVQEYRFELDSMTYRMVDICGSVTNRTKMMNHFEGDDDVHCVFFVALDEYDQTNLDDFGNENEEVDSMFQSRSTFPWYQLGGHNGLEESKIIFRTLLMSSWGENMFLLMNKCDLLNEKMETGDYVECFQEFPFLSSRSIIKVHDFVLSQFLNLNPNPENIIYCFDTCLIDTQRVRTVFLALKMIFISFFTRRMQAIWR